MTNNAPGKPFQSKLRPYIELIRQWRRQRKTYRHIATLLHDEQGVNVDHTTIFAFVKSRSRRRKVFTMADGLESPTASPPLQKNGSSSSGDAIERVRRKPKPEKKKKKFKFDINQNLNRKGNHARGTTN